MQTQNRAISLIDCLILLSIVLVVAGVLTSGLQNTEAHRLRDMELSRLRDLAAALHTYSIEDPDNIYGPVHPDAALFFGEGYSDYGGGPGTSLFTTWGEQFDPSDRPLNRLIYGYSGEPIPANRQTQPGDRSVYREFQCLGNDLGFQAGTTFFAPNELNMPYFMTNGTSFRMNNLTITGGGAVTNSYGIYARPTTRIPAPSETIALMEARAFQTVFTSPNSVFFQGTELDLTGYHDRLGAFMLAYSDGHAAFADMRSNTYFVRGTPGAVELRGTWGRMDCSEDPMVAP